MCATGSWAQRLISAVRPGRVVSSRITEFCGSARLRIGGAVKPSVALPRLVLELSQLGRLADACLRRLSFVALTSPVSQLC